VSQFYLNNENLKATGVPISYTEEELDEFILCKQDPIYFIRNYCKIVSLDHGLILFKLYEYQVDFIKTLQDNRWVISMQPRQMGKSQVVAAYILWYCLFNGNTQSAILANKAVAAREIMSRFQLMYEYLPKFLQQGVKVWNKGNIELENGSKVFTAATTGSGLRGKTLNLVYMDETAIVPNNVFEDFFVSTYPTISSGKTTKIIMTSTPLGYNHFWKFWTEAENGINGFVPFRVRYDQHPERNKAWADEQLKILGELKFTQEVNCDFLGSSHTLIRADVVAALPMSRPIFSKDGLDVYEKAIKKDPNIGKDHSYIMVVDTAKGTGGDYSAFTIIDVTISPYKVVGKYRDNKIAPLLFPSIIYKTAKDYNDAWVLFEINASEQVPHIMWNELEYENILFVSRTAGQQTVSAGFGGKSFSLGVTTDKRVKRIGCANFKALVEEGQLFIPDSDIIAEMTTFVQVKDSFAADDGYHDDLVMTLVLFGWLTTQAYFKDLIDIDMRKIIYQSRIDSIDAELLPIGWYSDGTETEQEVMLNF
jgi:hypothetical protein